MKWNSSSYLKRHFKGLFNDIYIHIFMYIYSVCVCVKRINQVIKSLGFYLEHVNFCIDKILKKFIPKYSQ